MHVCATPLLKWCVGGGQPHARGSGSIDTFLQEAKIDQLDKPFWCETDVVRLDITVDEGRGFVVQVGQDIAQLGCIASHLSFGQWLVLLL